MLQPLIGITGATGRVGGGVARALADLGAPIRLIVRDKTRAPRLANAEVVQADYGDGAAMRAALDGVGRLLFVSGNTLRGRLESHKTVVAAAREARVGRVVYTSFLGAGPDAVFSLSADHWATEAHMAKLEVPYVAMRNSFYAEIVAEMADGGVIRGPGGDGAFAPVTRADVIDTAAALLTTDDVPAGPLDVTGPEALTLHDVARIFEAVTGTPSRYVQESIAEAYASRRSYNASEQAVRGWVTTYEAIACGELSAVTDTIERYAGHRPTDFATFLRKHHSN